MGRNSPASAPTGLALGLTSSIPTGKGGAGNGRQDAADPASGRPAGSDLATSGRPAAAGGVGWSSMGLALGRVADHGPAAAGRSTAWPWPITAWPITGAPATGPAVPDHAPDAHRPVPSTAGGAL